MNIKVVFILLTPSVVDPALRRIFFGDKSIVEIAN